MITNLSNKYHVELIDMADHVTIEDYKKMIFKCDNHWNSYGHSYASNLIFENSTKYTTYYILIHVGTVEASRTSTCVNCSTTLLEYKYSIFGHLSIFSTMAFFRYISSIIWNK